MELLIGYAKDTNKKLIIQRIENEEAETKISEIAELHSYHYLSNGEKYIPNQAIIKEKLGCLLWNIAEYCSLNGWKLEEIVKQTYRIDGEKENGND